MLGSWLYSLDARIHNGKAEVQFDNLPTVGYCPSTFRVFMENLIDNGIKFNNNPKPVIQITHQIENGFLKLMISDNGIGIEEKFQKKIFEMFTRLHNRSEYSGSGMGLSYCKKALNLKGETISVKSEIGKGTTFTVRLRTKAAQNYANSSSSLTSHQPSITQ